jgi:4'-phosphopantetheinyl transferase
MTEPGLLAAGVVDLWSLDPSQLTASSWAELGRHLSPDEQRRADESPALAQELIAGRGLLRVALASYLRVEPASLCFGTNEDGKPHLVTAEGIGPLHFNLAHTRGLVVCAMARSEVGLDAEYAGRTAPLAVSRRYFSPREQAALRGLGPNASSHFFKYWTVKEAWLKGLGRGLSALENVECDFDGGRLRLSHRGEVELARRWSVVTWRATSCHQLAVALHAPKLVLRFRSHGFSTCELRAPDAAPVELSARTRGPVAQSAGAGGARLGGGLTKRRSPLRGERASLEEKRGSYLPASRNASESS